MFQQVLCSSYILSYDEFFAVERHSVNTYFDRVDKAYRSIRYHLRQDETSYITKVRAASHFLEDGPAGSVRSFVAPL